MSRSFHGSPIADAGDARTGTPSLSDLPSPRLGSRRLTVLQSLRESSTPLGVSEVAALARMHPNTARFHLDALATSDLVARTIESRTTRGRPRVLYEVRAEAMDQRSYRLLAEMLAELAAAPGDAREGAVAVGRTWGRRIVERHASEGAVGADRAVAVVTQVFEDIGFQPETSTTGHTATLLLRHCPFREVASRHPAVVCGVHLGMLEGALAGVGGAAVADSLEPLVTPRLCVARVNTAPSA